MILLRKSETVQASCIPAMKHPQPQISKQNLLSALTIEDGGASGLASERGSISRATARATIGKKARHPAGGLFE